MCKNPRDEYAKKLADVFNAPKTYQNTTPQERAEFRDRMRNAAKDAMDSLMKGGSPMAGKEDQDMIEKEVNELRDKFCELFAGKKAYSCIMAAGQALTMGTCMIADIDIKTEEGQKQAKGITEKVQKFIGQTVAEALVGSKTPDALMNFVKDSLSKLKNKDTIKDIMKDMGPPEATN